MTVPRDRFVTVNGVRLHTVDWGGAGPALVFHHATGFHGRVYDAIARRLARRFRVVTFDARGHGDSEKPIDGYSWQSFVADLTALVDALGMRGGTGVGHSLGGTTVAGAAAADPDLFVRTVLLDPIFVPSDVRDLIRKGNPMADAARRRRATWPDFETVIASYGSRPPFESWRDEALRGYVEHGFEPTPDGQVQLKCAPEIEARVFSMAKDFCGLELLGGVRVPTLLVRGENSDTFSAREIANALGHLATGKRADVPATGHLFPMEAPEQVAELIEDFAS